MVASVGPEVEGAVIGAEMEDAVSVASLGDSPSTLPGESVAGEQDWRPLTTVAAGLEAALIARAPSVHPARRWSASSPARSAAFSSSTITSDSPSKSAHACGISG